ncbi:MAG: hypothetical protein JWL83_1753 [Actinomycetia bacterium]|nr:hypothetical protein [Actinomycetes bacterium]
MALVALVVVVALVTIEATAAPTHRTEGTSTTVDRTHPVRRPHAGPPRIVIAGDSASLTLGFNIDPATAREAQWSGAQKLGCGFMRTGTELGGVRDDARHNCAGITRHWANVVAATKPDLVVMIGGSWEMINQIVGGVVVEPGSAPYDAALRADVEEAVQVFSRHGARVVFTDIPCYGPSHLLGDAERTDPARRVAINRVLDDVAAHDHRLEVLHWSDILCASGTYRERINGVLLRPDGVHFDPAGAHEMWKWLGPRLIERARARQLGL